MKQEFWTKVSALIDDLTEEELYEVIEEIGVAIDSIHIWKKIHELATDTLRFRE